MKYLVVFMVMVLGLAGCGAANSPATTAPAAPASGGAFLIGQQDDLWRFELPSKQWTQVTRYAPNSAASQPAVSPDGTQVVYAYRPQLPTPSAAQPFVVPRTELQIVPVSGGSGTPLHPPLEGFDSLDQPAWSPDGTTIYAHRQILRFAPDGTFTGSGDVIVAVSVANQTITTVISNALFPAIAPNGTTLAFVRVVQDRPQLVVYDLARQTEQVLLADPNFAALEAPVWSADGTTIYLAASLIVLGHAVPAPLRWFAAESASAHGLGWRLWRVDVAQKKGTELNTQLFEDPRIVLNDTTLTVWTLSGLWQLDLRQPAAPPKLIIEPGDIGGIAPLP